MTDTSRERTGQFVKILIEILSKNSEGLPAKTALERVASAVTLTPYESGFFENGTRRFEKILRFATIDLVKAGWLIKKSGTWYVTEDGISAYRKFSDPGDLYREATRLYRVWKTGQKLAAETMEEPEEEEKTAEEKSAVTFEEAEEHAWAEIEAYIRSFPPYDFQQLVADLVEAMGYHVSWIAPPGKDGGTDIIAYSDPLGTKSPRIKIQVKRNTDKTNIDVVRAFGVLIGDDDVGLFFATGGFTRDAEDFARGRERQRITLINIERFIDLWIEYFDKLSDIARQKLPLRPIHYLAL